MDIFVHNGFQSKGTGFQLTVNDVAPRATFSAPSVVNEGDPFVISLANPSDPSSADTAAGFHYAFDCGSGYGSFGSSSSADCVGGSGSSQTVKAKIQDKDGAVMEYTANVQVVPDITPPAVTDTRLSAGQTGVARYADVTATFSEKMDPSTINAFTFELYKWNKKTGRWVQVNSTSATVNYDASSKTAILDLYGNTTTLLAANRKYKAVVTTGAKDLAGNPLDQNATTSGNQQKSWTFTTGSA